MIKEVELIKTNNETQYVDWESGEELFKRSECIPITIIKSFKRMLEKEAKKDWDSAPMYIIEKIETIDELLKYNKEK